MVEEAQTKLSFLQDAAECVQRVQNCCASTQLLEHAQHLCQLLTGDMGLVW